jgi:hypothetical protein
MGKELVGVCKKHLEVSTWGESKCRCVGIANLLGEIAVNTGDWKSGGASFQQLAGGPATGQLSKLHFPQKVTKYPADTGGTCDAWDNGRHPACKDEDPSKRPEWCENKWCYVDPCSCDLDVPPKVSFYVPGATFQNIPIYYSYSTCGSNDTWTAKYHKDACVNQKSATACGKLDKCHWTGKNCLGKELVGHCPRLGKPEKSKSSRYFMITFAFTLLLSILC